MRGIIVIQGAVAVALLFNAAFPSLAQAGAIYATAVTAVLVSSGLAYLLAVERLRPEIDGRAQNLDVSAKEE